MKQGPTQTLQDYDLPFIFQRLNALVSLEVAVVPLAQLLWVQITAKTRFFLLLFSARTIIET